MQNNHPFIAIDLETTGLDPQRDQILQIGAVAYGGYGEPAEFNTYVRHERYEGDAFALQMNAEILRKLADKEARIPDAKSALMSLSCFLDRYCGTQATPHPVGFNVGPFDMAFIRAAWPCDRWPFHHRCIELGSLYASPAGFPATSSEITYRALGRDVTHDALQDARDARELHQLWCVNVQAKLAPPAPPAPADPPPWWRFMQWIYQAARGNADAVRSLQSDERHIEALARFADRETDRSIKADAMFRDFKAVCPPQEKP
jgi:oligoribonuclease (3'-5' exoribonuclease)